MRKFGIHCLGFILGIGALLLSAHVMVTLWQWYVVGWQGLEPMPFIVAVGLRLLFVFIHPLSGMTEYLLTRIHANEPAVENYNDSKPIIYPLATILISLFCWFFGWIWHLVLA